MFFLFFTRSGVHCPFCDEKASPRARVCPYCTRDLEGDPTWEERCRQRRRHIARLFAAASLCLIAIIAFFWYDARATEAARRKAAAMPDWTPPHVSPQPR
jgi:hypothetical protein